MSGRLDEDSPFVDDGFGGPSLRIRRFVIALIGGLVSAGVGFVIEMINLIGDAYDAMLGGAGDFAASLILRIWDVPLTVAGSSTAEFVVWLESTGPFAFVIAVVAAVLTGWALLTSIGFALDQLFGVVIR